MLTLTASVSWCVRKRTQSEDGFYDSAFGLPDFTKPQPPPLPLRVVAPASACDRSVAVVIDTPELKAQVLRTLAKTNLAVGGAELIGDASLILFELGAMGARMQVEALRSRARPDAAIVAISL